MLQDLILRTRLCSTGLITQPGWLFHFHPTKIRVKMFCANWVPAPNAKGTSVGLALKYVDTVRKVGRACVI